jgi:superoxide reductase
MTVLKQIYRCSICGNVVEVLHTGVGQLVCCGQPMNLFKEKEQEEGLEKHLPVIKELSADVDNNGKSFEIKVGEVEHPMEEGHYIEWIEVNTVDGKSNKKFLKPNEKPIANFCTEEKITSVRVYCNIHGLWEKK